MDAHRKVTTQRPRNSEGKKVKEKLLLCFLWWVGSHSSQKRKAVKKGSKQNREVQRTN